MYIHPQRIDIINRLIEVLACYNIIIIIGMVTQTFGSSLHLLLLVPPSIKHLLSPMKHIQVLQIKRAHHPSINCMSLHIVALVEKLHTSHIKGSTLTKPLMVVQDMLTQNLAIVFTLGMLRLLVFLLHARGFRTGPNYFSMVLTSLSSFILPIYFLHFCVLICRHLP